MSTSTVRGARGAGTGAPSPASGRPRRRRPAPPSMAFDALFDTAPDGSLAEPAPAVAAVAAPESAVLATAAVAMAAPPAAHLHHRPAEGQTFDEIIAGVWEDLSAHRTVTCPVCRAAAMRPRYGAGQGAVGGRCGDCGSVLG